MKTLQSLLLTLALTTTPATAWTFTWRNADGDPFIEESTYQQPCKQIQQAAGKEFVFNPGDSPFSFYIWSNKNCNGPYSGMTPPARWGKPASTDLRSYMVNYGDKNGPSPIASSSTTSATATGTASSTSSSAASSTSTSTPSSTPDSGNSSSSSSSLSGGAIAGIVIGAVAGIALVGGAFWLGRRRRGGSGSASAPGPGDAPQGFGSASGMGHGDGYVQPGTPIAGSEATYAGYTSPEVAKPPLTSMYENHPMSPVPPYQPRTFVELPGESAVVEMSDTQRVNELDGSGKGSYR